MGVPIGQQVSQRAWPCQHRWVLAELAGSPEILLDPSTLCKQTSPYCVVT